MEQPLCSADGGGPADGGEGFTTAESSYSIKLLNDNRLSLWYLCNLCVKLYSITRSEPLPFFHPVVADLRHMIRAIEENHCTSNE